jgi:hypothetical protein
MRRPPLRYVIVAVVASVIALVGLIWSLTIGKRSPIAVRQRAAQNRPLQAERTHRHPLLSTDCSRRASDHLLSTRYRSLHRPAPGCPAQLLTNLYF